MANKAIDRAYLLDTLRDFKSVILDESYIEKFDAYADMPAASATTEGKVIQYVGADDSTHGLTNGFFYQVQESSTTPGTYEWVEKAVMTIPDGVEYSIVKEATADAGYFATYQLYGAVGGGTPAPITGSDKINIPKDFLVKSGEVKTVTAADKAPGGIFENDPDFLEGDKYIDFVVNVKDGTPAVDEHLYINVKSLVDTYTAGNGLDLTSGTFSVVAKANGGVDVDANGVFLDFEDDDIDFTTEWDEGPSV